MALIRTVLGDIPAESLGPCHCHDHLYVLPSQYTRIPDRLWLDDYDKTRQEVESVAGLVRAIVDAQPLGAGRHAQWQADLSRDTGVTVIASTGLHKPAFYDASFWSFTATVECLAEAFTSEIEQGMYGYHNCDPFDHVTEVKAGCIKIATDEQGLTKYTQRVFQAAALTHIKTGAPILTHTETCEQGLEQADFLMAAGVKPDRLLISHMDRMIDVPRHVALAQKGVFLQYDTLARPRCHSDQAEVELIKAMLQQGFEDQILLGSDSTRERFHVYHGHIGLDYLTAYFLPLLRDAGVTDTQVTKMLMCNPQRALAFG